MHAFTVHPQKKPAPAPDAKPRRRRRRWVAVLALLFGLTGLVWAVRPDPHLARVKELQKELSSPEAKNLSPDERKARFAELRTHMKQLSDGQKQELFAPMREKQKAEMSRYVSLSPAEKVKYLDAQIDRSEKMRKEWEKLGVGARPGGPPGGFPGGGPGGPGGNKAGGPGGPGGPGGGGPPGAGRGPGQGRSPEEIEKRRKQMLDNTTPEERAQRDQFRKEMNDRRRQRGLPVTTR